MSRPYSPALLNLLDSKLQQTAVGQEAGSRREGDAMLGAQCEPQILAEPAQEQGPDSGLIADSIKQGQKRLGLPSLVHGSLTWMIRTVT